ncbi:MAG: hypothetical protein ACYTHK_16410 [Planctomycetota bacterium]|jgi:hypothetical protein
MNDTISADTLDQPIDGIGLHGRSLRAELGGEHVLLVFLRHLG